MYDTLNQLLAITIRMLFTNICIFYIYIKIINFKTNKQKVFIAIISSFILSIAYSFIRQYLNLIPATFIIYFIYNIILANITKNKVDVSVIHILIALAISNIAVGISMILLGPFLYIINPNAEIVIYYIITGILQLIIVFSFFKIKRFRKGIEFLQNNSLIKHMGVYVFIFITNVILILELATIYWEANRKIMVYLFAELIIVGTMVVSWIWRELTSFYQASMKENHIKNLENKVDELKTEIERLLIENEGFSKTIMSFRFGLIGLGSFATPGSNSGP